MPPTSTRTRGPSQKVTAEVHQATLALLKEKGMSGLSMELIAKQASVNKTTLYRRWGNINELIKDIIAEIDIKEPDINNTGSLKGDLLNLATEMAKLISKPEVITINRLIAANVEKDLEQLLKEYWQERSGIFTRIIDWARERDEHITEDTFALAIDMIVGPFILRTLISREPIDMELIKETADVAHHLLTRQ